MAQSVEHVIGNDEVIGSIPITSSKPEHMMFGFFFIKKVAGCSATFLFYSEEERSFSIFNLSSRRTNISTAITAYGIGANSPTSV